MKYVNKMFFFFVKLIRETGIDIQNVWTSTVE